MITDRKVRFALTGASGFIAPRHMKAIEDVGGDLVAVLDPHSSVGVLDKHGFHTTRYFKRPEQFGRELVKRFLREQGVDYLSVCSPNFLHDAHCRMGMDAGTHVICEKPLVIKPSNLDALQQYEGLRQRSIFALLQMRYHAEAERIRQMCADGSDHVVELNYVTPRGDWYLHTWKNRPDEAGGLITNIGVHFLDLLMWIFGPCSEASVNTRTDRLVAGSLQLERATVRWSLSISYEVERQRLVSVNGEKFDFTTGFDNLHTKVYEEILAGRGFGIDDARPSIELAYRLHRLDLT